MDNQTESFKKTAELLYENDLPVFIVDIFGNYYFGEIVMIGDLRLTVDNTAGKRKGERSYFLWSQIRFIDEKREKREINKGVDNGKE